MFISALQTPVVVAIIIVIAVQYAFALFCLLKLAYLDITKREYVLWNLFILLVFFIGGIAFLVYYYKVGKDKRIPPYVPEADKAGEDVESAQGETESAETDNAPSEAEPDGADDSNKESATGPTENDNQ